jgi:SPP1 gp7 family putative phage head morphogenesis protein
LIARAQLLARRGQAEIDRLQRRGVNASRRMSAQLRQIATAAFTAGRPLTGVREQLMRALIPQLRDAMLATHLVGVKTERSLLGLRLSVYDATLRVLGNLLNLDTRALQLQYQTQAIRISSEVGDKVERELRETMNDLIAEGAHVAEGKKVLGDAFNRLGLTAKSDYLLETVYRTQTQMAYGAGRWEADQDPAVQEILWGYTYTAVMDDRTRDSHAALDGVTLPKEHPLWETIWPPNGWNCRCAVIPIFEEEESVLPGVEGQADDGFGFNPGRIFTSARAL